MATASSESSPARQRVSSEILDRQPPSNFEAERGVLGSVVLLPEVLDEVVECVRPDDFYD
jgi:replicative DNA helicase